MGHGAYKTPASSFPCPDTNNAIRMILSLTILLLAVIQKLLFHDFPTKKQEVMESRHQEAVSQATPQDTAFKNHHNILDPRPENSVTCQRLADAEHVFLRRQIQL